MRLLFLLITIVPREQFVTCGVDNFECILFLPRVQQRSPFEFAANQDLHLVLFPILVDFTKQCGAFQILAKIKLQLLG